MKRINKKILVLVALILLVVPILAGIVFKDGSVSFSGSGPIKMNPEKDAIYSIIVSYDSTYKDSKMNNTIHVEDILPEGLNFVEFIQKTNDQLINSNKLGKLEIYYAQYDSYFGCTAQVRDGVNGLKYDPNTRKISFDIIDMSDGCQISVDVRVSFDPTTTRIDHYNTARVKVGNNYYKSNTIHSYIGDDSATLYSVNYRIEGEHPTSLNKFYPLRRTYSAGQQIMLDEVPDTPGYTFNGWTSNDVTISNGKFTMPSNDVELIGTFTPNNETKYSVTYKTSGDVPEDFVLPSTKEYYSGEIVTLYSVTNNKAYTVKYSFSSTVDLNDNEFTMPNKDIEVTLTFENNIYGIRYKFMGEYMPNTIEIPNSTVDLNSRRAKDAKNYLGTDEKYSLHYAGDHIVLPKYKVRKCTNKETREVVNCRFVGWYYNDEFDMPSAFITAEGLWAPVAGTFEPKIDTAILNSKDKYYKGDVVEFKTTIKNTADVDITNVKVQNNLKNQNYTQSDKYKIEGEYIIIYEIKAGSSVDIFSTYNVVEDEVTQIANTFEIIAATAPNDYYLENTDYIAEVSFDVDTIGSEVNETNTTVVDEPNETNTTIIPESNTPKTGDDIWIYFLILGVSVVVIFVVIKLLKKKEE